MIPDRAALRARQGAGARYDAESAPHEDLLLARRGTAYFARVLNGVSDAELSGASLRPGLTRAHVVAQVSHQARAMALGLKALHSPLIAEEAAWYGDLALAATLPARALRALFEHSAKHLDVEWRDLPGPLWRGQTLALPRQRARAIWRAALDMDHGGRARDVPDALAVGPETGQPRPATPA